VAHQEIREPLDISEDMPVEDPNIFFRSAFKNFYAFIRQNDRKKTEI
jgi:hypothetical protein